MNKTLASMGGKTSQSRRGKVVAGLVLTGVVVLALAAPAYGQVTAERAKKRGQVTVGYRVDTPPFSFKDAAGQPAGYSIDLCRPIAEELAKQVGLGADAIRYLPVGVDQRERFIKGGNIDLMCASISDTPERRKSASFSPPIFIASVKILVTKQSNVKSLAELAGGKPIAVIGTTTAAQAVQGYAKQKGLALTTANAVGPEAALGQIKLGWASGYARDDVLLAEQVAGLADAKDYLVLPEGLSQENIAIAYTLNDAALGKMIVQNLGKSYAAGTWASTYERWFMKPIAAGFQPLNMPASDALKAGLAKLN